MPSEFNRLWRGCCGCRGTPGAGSATWDNPGGSGWWLFATDSRFTFSDTKVTETPPDPRSTEVAKLQSGESVTVRVPWASSAQAWEFELAFAGLIDVHFDYDPDDEANTGVLFELTNTMKNPMTGTLERATTLTSGSDSTVDGQIDGRASGETAFADRDHAYFRTAPRYALAQYPSRLEYLAGEGLRSEDDPTQVAVIEEELTYTGWIKITARENDVLLIAMRPAELKREWLPGYDYGYGYGTWADVCPKQDVLGWLYDIGHLWYDHSSTWCETVWGIEYCDGGEGYLTDPPNTRYYSGGFLDGNGRGRLLSGSHKIHDPDPDPVTGDLWPVPSVEVWMQSYAAFECTCYIPPVPPATVGEFVSSNVSHVVTYTDYVAWPDFRTTGWNFQIEFDSQEDGPLCDSDDPYDCWASLFGPETHYVWTHTFQVENRNQ